MTARERQPNSQLKGMASWTLEIQGRVIQKTPYESCKDHRVAVCGCKGPRASVVVLGALKLGFSGYRDDDDVTL